MARRAFVPFVLASSFVVAACSEAPLLSPVPVDGPSANKGAVAAQPGRYLVGFDGPTTISADVLAASGGQVVDQIGQFNVVVVDGVTNPAALQGANPKYIESGFDVTLAPSTVGMMSTEQAQAAPEALTASYVTNGRLWGMRAIEAPEGWTSTTAGAGVNVCIVDSGVDSLHQELRTRVTRRSNWVTAVGQNRIDDPYGHGSHVAGTAAGHGFVAPGVAPRANIMSARVLNTSGSGTESAIVNGMNWCVANGAHVINMSLGGVRYRGTAAYTSSPITYGLAIDNATSNGVVVVVSAGNDNMLLPNPALIYVPAQVPGTIIIGATAPTSKSTAPTAPSGTFNPFDPANVWRSTDSKAYYSQYGSAVHVFAPGGRGGIPLNEVYRRVGGVIQGLNNDFIWSACSSQAAGCTSSTTFYTGYAGTSMAAPHVSGMVAVLYGELGGVRSVANRARIENCIKSTTDDIGPSSTFGGGRVNLKKAIAALRANAC